MFLGDVRKYIHSKFNLPCDKPLFRRVLTCSFHEDEKSVPYLLNVHHGLPPSGGEFHISKLTFMLILSQVFIILFSYLLVDGNVSLIQGNYLYYHYMQDSFNDSGWGCAYRSLQTIFSWYKYVPLLFT